MYKHATRLLPSLGGGRFGRTRGVEHLSSVYGESGGGRNRGGGKVETRPKEGIVLPNYCTTTLASTQLRPCNLEISFGNAGLRSCFVG
eukprot:SAG11_NODE_1736_length_4344_cov_1.763722_3_plen_88_part_00